MCSVSFALNKSVKDYIVCYKLPCEDMMTACPNVCCSGYCLLLLFMSTYQSLGILSLFFSVSCWTETEICCVHCVPRSVTRRHQCFARNYAPVSGLHPTADAETAPQGHVRHDRQVGCSTDPIEIALQGLYSTGKVWQCSYWDGTSRFYMDIWHDRRVRWFKCYVETAPWGHVRHDREYVKMLVLRRHLESMYSVTGKVL